MVRVRVQCPYDGCDGMAAFETDPESKVVARRTGHVELAGVRKLGKQLLAGTVIKEEHLRCPRDETHEYTAVVEL